MFPFKDIACFGMIEIQRTLDDREGLFRMALDTVLSEFIVMYILMTIHATLVADSFEFLEFFPVFDSRFMTSNAKNLLVLPQQLKF